MKRGFRPGKMVTPSMKSENVAIGNPDTNPPPSRIVQLHDANPSPAPPRGPGVAPWAAFQRELQGLQRDLNARIAQLTASAAYRQRLQAHVAEELARLPFEEEACVAALHVVGVGARWGGETACMSDRR